jgi:hypothetical protein
MQVLLETSKLSVSELNRFPSVPPGSQGAS